MDTEAEAVDYDTMDHGEVNRVFVDDLLAEGPGPGEMLDLGTGTAQIPIELCRRHPEARVLAVDVAEHMIRVGRQNVEAAGLQDRIHLQCVDAKRLPWSEGRFATVISNSIVHHLAEPIVALQEAWRVAVPGGLIFFRDLFRPADETELGRIVETYAAGANDHQRQMFADSLRAALTVEEMRELVARLDAPPESVRATSDRHWTWIVRKA
jgi:ubiquinone/menaquinone biosynthesis C-methylase UbiE